MSTPGWPRSSPSNNVSNCDNLLVLAEPVDLTVRVAPVVVVPADLADSDLQVAVPAAQVDRAVDLDNLGKVDRSKVSLNALRWSLLSSLR